MQTEEGGLMFTYCSFSCQLLYAVSNHILDPNQASDFTLTHFRPV